MSQTQKAAVTTLRHETAAQPPDTLLTQILDRMDAIAAQGPRVSPIGISTFAELERFAERSAKSSMVPPAYRGKPDDIILAVQFGSEIGLAPMQALQSIAVINNRPAVWGDAMLGLCRASPHCKDIIETYEGTEGTDNYTAVCIAHRRGSTPSVARFSVGDARKAGLLGKDTYKSYLARMIRWRARSWACRDAFPDVLKGLTSVEEVADTPAEVEEDYRRTALDAGAAAAAAAKPAFVPSESNAPAAALDALWAACRAEDRKPKGDEWLSALEADLAAADSADAVGAIISRDDVQRSQDGFKNGAKARLEVALNTALARTKPAATEVAQEPDDDSPGAATRDEAA